MTTDTIDFFAKSEYSKYYFLATSKEDYLYLSGLPKIDSEHESAKLRTYMPSYGSIEGYLVAKPPLYQELGENGLEVLFMIDNNYEGIRVGTMVGDRWYDAEMDEIIDSISH